MKRPTRWLIAPVLLAILLVLVAVIPDRTTRAQADGTRPRAMMPATPGGLDRTGTTVPLTNYPIPTGAVFMSPQGADEHAGTRSAPVRTLNRAISLAPAGGTIVLRGGEYRDWYHNRGATSYRVVRKSLTFQAYPGEAPWLNGADLVSASAFTKSAGTTSTTSLGRPRSSATGSTTHARQTSRRCTPTRARAPTSTCPGTVATRWPATRKWSS